MSTTSVTPVQSIGLPVSASDPTATVGGLYYSSGSSKPRVVLSGSTWQDAEPFSADVNGFSYTGGNVGIGVAAPTAAVQTTTSKSVRDANPVVTASGNQNGTVAHAIDDFIKFNITLADNYSGFNTTTHQYTVPITGYYLVTCNVFFNNSSPATPGEGVRIVLADSSGNLLATLNSVGLQDELMSGGAVVMQLTSGTAYGLQLINAAYSGTINLYFSTPVTHSTVSFFYVGS